MGDRTPAECNSLDVLRWRDHLIAQGRTDATVRARVSAVSAWYAWLTRPMDTDGRSILTANPAARVACKPVPMYGRSRKLSEDAFKAILQRVSDPHDRAWLMAYVLTGRRRTELATLHWEQITRTGSRWTYTYTAKGGKRNTREVPRPVVQAVLAFTEPRDSGPVWSCSATTMARRLKAYALRAGLDPRQVRLHGLRHLAAQKRYEKTADIKAVQEFLGHGSPAITDVYLQGLREDKDTLSDDVWGDLSA